MKARLKEVFTAALGALDPGDALPRRMSREGPWLVAGSSRVNLDDARSVRVVSMGKAAHRLLDAALPLLDGARVEGIVVAPGLPERGRPGIVAHVGSHPYPDADSFAAADAVLRFAAECGADDLALFLVSGGGSSLVERPVSPSIGLDDCHAFYELLVTCGAGIVEMNVLRKHFSAVKGGRLALAASPARQLTLYVCDVPSAHPSAVASGPTMPDESTVADCLRIVDGHGLRERLPPSYRALLDGGGLPETPKEDHPAFARCAWHRLIGTEEGVAELERRCRALGWVVETDVSVDDRPVDEAVEHLLAALDALAVSRPGRTVALVTGGELSCPVTGDGRGGRNQAFVLRCARRIEGRRVAVLSAGTDGIDGNSPAAGAVADGETAARARAAGLDPAAIDARSDSYSLFAALGDDVTTGPTGNNIRDLRVLVAW